jgi:hypothetical protein
LRKSTREGAKGKKLNAFTPGVNGEEKEDPDDVDEVPVPRSTFETEVGIGGEVVTGQAVEGNSEEEGSNDNVSTMESSESVKSWTVDTISNSEGGINIFIALEKGEKGGQNQSQNETSSRFGAISSDQGSMGPGKRSPRSQEKDSVEKRNEPRVNDFDSSGRPNGTNLRSRWKGGVEKGPEEGEEEHDFGNDEENSTSTETLLDGAGVVPFKSRFTDDVAPPEDSEENDGEEAEREKEVTTLEGVSVESKARNKGESGKGGGKGPGRRVDKVIGVKSRSSRTAGHEKKGRKEKRKNRRGAMGKVSAVGGKGKTEGDHRCSASEWNDSNIRYSAPKADALDHYATLRSGKGGRGKGGGRGGPDSP